MKPRGNHDNIDAHEQMPFILFCGVNRRTSLLLADNFCDSMANYCPCLFDFLPGKADSHAYFQGRNKDLLGFKVVIESL